MTEDHELADARKEMARLRDELDSRSEVTFFWSPPQPGETILGMLRYRDIVVVATTCGVYTIGDRHHSQLEDFEVRKVSDAVHPR